MRCWGRRRIFACPPNIRVVHPNDDNARSPPHQDGGRVVDMDKFVIAWIPLVEIDQQCGGLALYPSLGHAQPLHEKNGTISVGAAPVQTIYASPGDVVFFHQFMTHGSMPNTSNRVPYSMDMRFCNSVQKLSKPAM